MQYADYVVLAIITISILVGSIRGFVKEAFSLAVWAAAFLIAFQYSGALALQLENHIELPSVRTSLAFAGLFISVLLVGGLLTFLVGKLVEKTGLSGTDRLLGGVFGGVRGVALVLAMILFAGMTPLPQDPWWQQSRTIQSLMPLAEWSAQFLPDYILEHMELNIDKQAAKQVAVAGL
ncbi:MAG: CvpA family protein [Lysobacterales bacterium]|jgi:membrane protein required for colicin V production